MPRAGPLLICDVSAEGEALVLSYRERGTGHGATIALSRRSARTLARMLEGTRSVRSSEPARVELYAEVRSHVQGKPHR